MRAFACVHAGGACAERRMHTTSLEEFDGMLLEILPNVEAAGFVGAPNPSFVDLIRVPGAAQP